MNRVVSPEIGLFSRCLVMAPADELIASYRVPENWTVRLKDYEPDWAGDPKVSKGAEQAICREVTHGGYFGAGRGLGSPLCGRFLVNPDDLPGHGCRRQR